MKKIIIDKNASFILNRLEENGFKAYVIGGSIRDYIMDITPKDIDIATSARPEEVKALFNKTIDTGIKHGTVTIVIDKIPYEVTTFRIDGEYKDNRKPENVDFTDDLYEDMLRRDFTMNAIGYNEKEGFVDYFNGFLDIENKIIRGVGDPLVRFEEDALRMLRAIRFCGTCNFTIEEKTYNAIVEKNYLLKNISAERIRTEITKLLLCEHNEKIELLVHTELIKYYDEDFYNYLKNNLEHIKEYIKYSKRDETYLFSALFSKLDYENTLKQMKLLKWDNKRIKDVSTIVSYFPLTIEKTDYFIRKMVSEVGFSNTEIILFFKQKLDNISYENEILYLDEIIKNNYPTSVKELAINGNDLQQMGIKDGKKIGEILKSLFEMVLENPFLNVKDELIKIVEKI